MYFMSVLTERITNCWDSDEEFLPLVNEINDSVAKISRVGDVEGDFFEIAGYMQYWLSQKAELEFLKRLVEKQMKLTSVPRLIELIKRNSYVSAKLIDTALEGVPEYADLSDRLSRVQLAIDTIQSGITGLWFKKDALVNLSASRRRHMDTERFD